MRVLITRPKEAASSLMEKIKSLGAIPESFPVMEFHATPLQMELKSAIADLDDTDIAIFVSKPSVQFALPLIQAHFPELPRKILWASVGPGTAAALRSFGISQVIFPDAAPYESESLLALDHFQNVRGKKIMIFRGNGGRDLLGQSLKERHATVNWIETYVRGLPQVDMQKQLAEWHSNPIAVIVSTSAACLHNLVHLVGQALPWIQELPLVVVGYRMLQLAQGLGFKQCFVAQGAEDASILEALRPLLSEKTDQ